MNGVYLGVLAVAAFLGACGVIWKIAVKPIIDGLGEIVDTIRGIKALIEPDADGLTLPQRVTTLEQAFADFLSKLGPMVETIVRLAGPAPRAKGTR